MPNKPAAVKALRQTRKRTVVNRGLTRELKLALKKARRVTAVRSAEAEQLLRQTVKLVDKAVRRKVLKKNTAARTKSRLMKLWQRTTG